MDVNAQIEALKAEIGRKAEALKPLQSEIATLRTQLKRLMDSQLGVTVGHSVTSGDGSVTWTVTKVRRIGQGENRVHVYGKQVLKSGELSKHARYIGILGFNCKAAQA